MMTTLATVSTAARVRALAARSFGGRISRSRWLATGLSRGRAAWRAPADGPEGSTRLAKLIGGKRGIIDGALPPLVFVVANGIATTRGGRSSALALAIGAALGTGAALVVLRLVRRETLKQALRGLAGLAVAVAFALHSGEARSFFLPGSTSTRPTPWRSPSQPWPVDPWSQRSIGGSMAASDERRTPDCNGPFF